MKKLLCIIIIIAMLLCVEPACAHRMFIGQRLTLDLYAFYDDGTPACSAKVKIFRDGALYAENVTDASGKFSIVLPGRGTGKWQYEIYGEGHSEKGYLNIDINRQENLNALGLAMLGTGLLAYRRRNRRVS